MLESQRVEKRRELDRGKRFRLAVAHALVSGKTPWDFLKKSPKKHREYNSYISKHSNFFRRKPYAVKTQDFPEEVQK